MTVLHSSFDRAAALREEERIVDRLRADAATRVIVVREGRVQVGDHGLVRVPADEVGEATWALLGRADDATMLLLASVPPFDEPVDTVPEEPWLALGDTAGRLGAEDTDLFVTAVALAAWLRDAAFCSACGSATELHQAGWSRHCPSCGREHFPRTDPAVIVAIESADGERMLLGANALWGGRLFSCFAGFVEAGESLEATVEREIEEETGVRLASVRYIGSQSWPYPRSLMLGFRAVVDDEGAARADGAEIIELRWFTREEIGSALEGNGPVALPGRVSIAYALIVDWYEERV